MDSLLGYYKVAYYPTAITYDEGKQSCAKDGGRLSGGGDTTLRSEKYDFEFLKHFISIWRFQMFTHVSVLLF